MKCELLNFDGRTEFRTLRGSEFRIIFSVHCTNLEKWLRFQIFEFQFSGAVCVWTKQKSELQHSSAVCAVASIIDSRITTEFIRDKPLELEFDRNWTSMVIHCHLVAFLVADWIVSQILSRRKNKPTRITFNNNLCQTTEDKWLWWWTCLVVKNLVKTKSIVLPHHGILYKKLKTWYIMRV